MNIYHFILQNLFILYNFIKPHVSAQVIRIITGISLQKEKYELPFVILSAITKPACKNKLLIR